MFRCGNLEHFFAKMFTSETISFHYFSPRIPNIKFCWTSNFGKWWQKTFKQYLKSEQIKKNCKNFFRHGDCRPCFSKSVQIWDHFFPLVCPKYSKSLKVLDVRFREMGAKRLWIGTSKVNKLKNKSVKNFFLTLRL